MDLLDAPFVLLVTHPWLFAGLLTALYALCWLPGLHSRRTQRGR